jgi:hypothetical protein
MHSAATLNDNIKTHLTEMDCDMDWNGSEYNSGLSG